MYSNLPKENTVKNEYKEKQIDNINTIQVRFLFLHNN